MLFWLPMASATLPTPQDEQRTFDALVGANEDARAVMIATSAAHHSWTSPRVCTPETDSTAARARRFLDAWRAVVVRATALADRLERDRDAPTLAPLRTSASAAAIAREVSRARTVETTWRGSAAWHRKEISPYSKRCSPVVGPAPGWEDRTIRAADDPAPLAAVLVLEAGQLCGGAEPLRVEPGVLLIETVAVCWSADACDCTPQDVLPGAALGAESR